MESSITKQLSSHNSKFMQTMDHFLQTQADASENKMHTMDFFQLNIKWVLTSPCMEFNNWKFLFLYITYRTGSKFNA